MTTPTIRHDLRLPGGRTLTYDDTGEPGGVPVVYLHGTPDSRLARHPDDRLATAAGVRLLAVDRPGYGGSSPLGPGSPPDRFAADLAGLLAALDAGPAVLLAWSGGAVDALRAAGTPALAGRLTGVWIVAGLVPCDASDDPVVRAVAPGRLGLLELAAALPPDELAAAMAPLLAPFPCDHGTALAHQLEQREPGDQAALATVPGAVDRMAGALVEAVRHGLAGVEADVRGQVEPLGERALARVTLPVHLRYGSADVVTPPAFGRWYATHLPAAELTIVDGAGHYLPFTHWVEILAALRS